ncbi:uncharacterized protein METZ01_LOCUS188825 [marine metagenome]|uniref:Uncharacterized protein n=1 Tax=marine metagenome TaxID=408172 RepID=A0A382DE71_9ZZZZ
MLFIEPETDDEVCHTLSLYVIYNLKVDMDGGHFAHGDD